ncbi:DNA mismatch repair endonuclease MutL [Halomarina rubra]|uniref:DNA mismatch repair protein MutL n=1 Tax=Halomarina rubra TaxID=2071873 RepID=A0ABD6AXT6_9EURY|nr:DNA mismatch repair endonuclease MutL [Halomarina rubra]
MSDSESTDAASVRRLDEETVARIAAGEVVTRPADAVRELVENALDAGASTVGVEVEDGGLSLLRVTDDGYGMSREDAERAVERHATSKIRDATDLTRAETLGFRGEALPSIAEVGRFDCYTSAESGSGTHVAVRDGDVSAEATGHGVGTTVEVRDLFGDLPARRESLGSARREFARISDVLTGYALARPAVRFRLSHDGRQVLSTPGSGDATEALLAVFDRDVAGQSTTVEATGEDDADGETVSDDAVRVAGVVCYPSVTRATASHVHVAVNGRPVDDSNLRNAVAAGYGTLLPASRHPVIALRVEVPPDRVDQNVHPAKREVRFTDLDTVTETVERAVREALSTDDLSRTAAVSFDTDEALTAVESRFDELRVIGQFRELYLLCEDDDDLLVVDQHAAHERVNFERLRDDAGDTESVPLDPPATLSLSAREAATLEAHYEDLAALGFAVESFGGDTYRVTEVPAPVGRVATAEAVRDVLDAFLAGDAPDDPRRDLLADLACHPSLKAGDTLAPDEAGDLLARLGECERPYACPHGRPTILRIDEATLAKGFGRSNLGLR